MLKLKLKMKQKLKKKKSVSGLFLLLALVFSSLTVSNAQAQKQISGIVLDQSGIPLPGVNIVQQNTNNGAVTDFDGKYSISLQQGGKVLVFSYVGFKEKLVTVGDKSTLDVTLEEDVAGLEEVVVIGYAPVAREKVLGAVSTVKSESIAEASPVDALQGVQGKVSGVQILSNNGPGEGFDIKVRGVSTLTEGATGPLYVVDGQQTFDIDNLDPSDIASLEVLKDGATAAIYGARAANGVVVITTKSGKAGKVSLTVNTTTGVNTLVGQIPVSNAEQRLIQERFNDRNRATPRGNLRDSLSLLLRNSPDIQELITRPAVRHQTNITLRGGGEKATFYWNTGFINEDGIINESSYKRFNTRLKVDVKASEKIKAGTLINGSFENIDGLNVRTAFNQILRRVPFLPIRDPDGSLVPSVPGFRTVNPLAVAEEATNNQRKFRASNFNYVQYQILPQLSIKSTLGIDFDFRKFRTFNPATLNPNFVPNSTTIFDTGFERFDLRYAIQQENFLNFKQKWGDHDLSAFAGMQIQVNASENLKVDSNFNNELIRTFNNTQVGTLESDNRGGDATRDTKSNIYSLFAGFNYDYANKYLLGATIRRDGSSRFGDNNKFGYFPSLTLGWRLSEEGFLSDSDVVNNLLIRGSYGVVGNDRIGDFDSFDQLNPNFIYNGQTGFGATALGNNDLKWEETESFNVGLDLAMFKKRLNINVDVWRKNTKDLLANQQLPEESGFASVRSNLGTIRNEGIDFNITGTVLKNKNFSWNAGFNIGLLRNEVTSFDAPINLRAYRVEEGQPIGNIIGFRENGVFQYDESNAFITEGTGDDARTVQLFPNFDNNGFFLGTYSRENGDLFPVENNGDIRQLTDANGVVLRGGDFIWKDANNDFIIDRENDGQEILGNGLATAFGGFSHNFKYKNFTMQLLFDYSFGNDIYREYDHERNSLRANIFTPSPDRILNAWSNQGDITPFATLDRGRRINRIDFPGGNSQTASSLYVTDGSFIKWRYTRFGYNVPKKTLNSFNLGLKKLSLNLAVNNVLTWTNYEGYNPEFGTRGNPLQPGFDTLRFPNDREILLGLSVQF